MTASPGRKRPGLDRHRDGAAAGKLNRGARLVDGVHRNRQEVHLRAADEAGDEQVARMVIELERRAGLLDDAALQHDDLVGHRHGLDLVVGDVDHGRGELLVQPGKLDPHLYAQSGIEIGERLVEQEDLGLPHDGAADGDALALAARQVLGLALQQRVRAAGCWPPPSPCASRSSLGTPARRRAKPMLSAHRHVRIERVGLEHHGQAAFGRRHVVDPLAVDQEIARGDLLEPGDHAQQGGLAAARRTDEDAELAVLDLAGRRP